MNLHCRINTIGLLAMDGKAFTNQAEGYSNSNWKPNSKWHKKSQIIKLPKYPYVYEIK